MITKIIISDDQANVLLQNEAKSRGLSVNSMLRKDKVNRETAIALIIMAMIDGRCYQLTKGQPT